MQAPGDAVDAAFRGHVLTEEERLRMPAENVCESTVDCECERQGLSGRSYGRSYAARQFGHGCG